MLTLILIFRRANPHAEEIGGKNRVAHARQHFSALHLVIGQAIPVMQQNDQRRPLFGTDKVPFKGLRIEGVIHRPTGGKTLDGQQRKKDSEHTIFHDRTPCLEKGDLMVDSVAIIAEVSIRKRGGGAV